MEIKIENLQNTFFKNLSNAKEEDLIHIDEERSIIQSKINNLSDKGETINCQHQSQHLDNHQEQTFIESDILSHLSQSFDDFQEQSFIESGIVSNLSQHCNNQQELSENNSKYIQKYSGQNTFSLKKQNQDNYETETQGYLNSKEDQEEEKSDILNIKEDDILEKQIEKLDDFISKNKKCYYLILGDTGTGKSSFIKKITENPNIETSSGSDSHTYQCQIYEKDGYKYIDTPGVNDTQKDKCIILLKIVQFLKNKQLTLDDLFILLVQNKDLKQLTILREFSYTYFLYELFGNRIEWQQVKRLVEEYNTSSYLLNWSQVGFHDTQDDLQDKRKIIFQNKNKASNYFEYTYAYHTRVLTFFDMTPVEILYDFDDYHTEFLKEQIWSQFNLEERFYAYNDYIKDQKKHLLNKIEQITRLEIKNKSLEFQKDFQNILLIGESQVGKSSLIEQLTNQKGLRGSGDKSQTQVCSTYRFDYGNTVYRFIDTPGYNGTETNQNQYHTFKIISDYLLRGEIKEFKLLFMINKGKDVRDKIFLVLNEFIYFIAYIFDQDVSFLDRQNLEDLLAGKQQDINLSKTLLKNKILQIFRIDNNYGNKQFNNEHFQYTIFKNNYRTNRGKAINVPYLEDSQQKQQLFEKINNIDSFTIDDKATFRIKKQMFENIISSSDEFMNQFNKIAQKYTDVSNFSQQITQTYTSNFSENVNILQELNIQIQQIIRELKYIQFIVLIRVYRQITDQVKKAQFSDKVKNNALKHFLPLQQNPILFEITDENPESILISKKQHYYSLQAHYLSYFVDINNEIHQKKLENLAEINLSQEISFQQIEQTKFIEKNYEKKPEENIQNIEKLSSLLNLINQKGIQSNKQLTHLSFSISQFQMLPIITYICQAEMILTPLRMGYDFYQLCKGYMCKQQFYLNTATNSLGFVIFIYAFIPGLGWIAGVSACMIGIGYTISSCFYTSKQTYDSTIGNRFRKIMNDTKPNQSLNQYEIAQLLKEKFELTNYQQLTEGLGYTMFRELEMYNPDDFQKSQLLVQLFNITNLNDQNDLISKFIVENYILSEIEQKIELLLQNDEINISHLEKCYNQLLEMQLSFKTFYYQTKYNDICDQAIDLISKKLKSEKKKKNQNQQSAQIEINEKEGEIFKQFQIRQHNFLEEFSKKITYENQVKLAKGAFRVDCRFKILFNSFCNLSYLKVEQKIKQPLIRELELDTTNMKFKIKNNNSFKENSFIFNCQNDNQLKELINDMAIVNKYTNNRFLSQVLENDYPNLTSLAQNEIIENKLQYSLDLLDLALQSKDEKDFISQIEAKLKQELEKQIENEKIIEKQNQLRSIIEKKVSVLNDNEMNYRIRSFYKSVYFLKDYFKN